jgi:hypothetical protein
MHGYNPKNSEEDYTHGVVEVVDAVNVLFIEDGRSF